MPYFGKMGFFSITRDFALVNLVSSICVKLVTIYVFLIDLLIPIRCFFNNESLKWWQITGKLQQLVPFMLFDTSAIYAFEKDSLTNVSKIYMKLNHKTGF